MSFIALCCMVSHQPEHRLHHANPDDAVLTIFITKAIIDLQLEISASAQRCGIVYSGRCLADPQGWHRPEDKRCEGPRFEALPILCSKWPVLRSRRSWRSDVS